MELRRKVEAILKQDGVDALLDQPAANLLADPTVTRAGIGELLGPYKLEAALGAGGMGQVYRGIDTRLGRAVAIKIVSERFSERFEREAKAISSLNHPNICTLYDVGPNYLVMELVDGVDLAERLKKGPLPLEQTLLYGSQVADALAAAHARGVVHRDLKPGNIMVAKAGVKVLDFGLAKSDGDETITSTRAIMGTPAYMAPEQREGAQTDPRTDIYALGLVLYEMATGKRAAPGQSLTLDALPREFAHVVDRCLAQDPARRWQNASDVKAELNWAGSSASAPETVKSRTSWLTLGLIAVLACASIGLAIALRLSSIGHPSESPLRFGMSLGEGPISEGATAVPVPSPDGRSLVFIRINAQGVPSLWLRRMDANDPAPLPGTEGATAPFWSPDGHWIAYYAAGNLKKVDQNGGPPQNIGEVTGVQNGSWGSKGDILIRPSNRMPLYSIRETGGPLRQVTKLSTALQENSHRYPQFLPDGRRFLFYARCGKREDNALYLGSLDSPSVSRIMALDSNFTYLPPDRGQPGVLLYYRDGALVSQPFDPDKGPLGSVKVVADKVGYTPASFLAHFATSNDGRTLVFGNASSGTRLVWFDRTGEQTGIVHAEGQIVQPRISPAGDLVLFSRPDDRTGNRDVWYTELARDITARLTTDPANDWFAVWSPDGKQLLFATDREGGAETRTYLKRSMDPGSGEIPLNIPVNPYDWSRDGKWISLGDVDILIASAIPPYKSFPFLATKAREGGARFSPDTRWLAYTSNESGRSEVYVRPFNGGPAAVEGKIQISNNGGGFPVWSGDGQEIFYMTADFSIYSVSLKNLKSGGPMQLPERLFRPCPGAKPEGSATINEAYQFNFDTRDGRRFLVDCVVEPPGSYQVLVNWAIR
jgi:serine/threonine protein kinase